MDQTHRLILDELEDRVERIFAATEDLREAIGDGKTSRELLESVFRNVHSLKASASSNGLDVLTQIAHQFENLLHSLRVGHTALNKPVLQAFDDTAEAMFSTLREDESLNFEELFSRLQLLSEPTDRADRVSRLEVDVILNAVPAEIWQALGEEEKHRLEQSLGEGASLFLITTRFDIANFDQLFQSLKVTLTDKGELISTAPTVDNERPDKINFRILYTRETDLEQLRDEVSNFTDATVIEVSPQQVSTTNERQEVQARYRRKPKSDSPLIRVELNELDKLISSTHQLFRDTAACLERAVGNSPELVDRVNTSFMNLAAELVNLRMIPIDRVLQRAYRAGRSAAASDAKDIEFSVSGNDIQFDKSLSDAISDPLIHLVRNAVDHGIESDRERKAAGKNARGRIRIEAVALQGQTRIRVSDDGRGIDPNLVCSAARRQGVIPDGASLDMDQSLRLLFRPGFSTASSVSETSGRGVGLDVVEAAIEDVGGAIRVDSEPGSGSVFEIRLPVTFSLLDVVVLHVGTHRYLIDAAQVLSTQRLKESESESFAIQIEDEMVPSFRIEELLGLEVVGVEPRILLHCNFAKQNSEQTRSLALKVGEPVETETLLVRNLGSRGGRWFGVAGAAEMRDGTVALLLDLPALTATASK